MPDSVRLLITTCVRGARFAWSAADRFDWFSTYLQQHGLALLLRLMVASMVAATSAIPVLMLGSPAGAQGPAAQTVAVTTSGLGFLMAGGWLVRGVSTSRQSMLFVVLADVLIAVGCAVDSSALAGLVGTTMFAAIGAYAAFFHGARVMMAHLGWSLGVVLILGVATALDGDVAMAVAKGLVVVIANAGIPLALLFMMGMLGADSEISTNDPLTGLVNRRGLDRALPALVRGGAQTGDEVTVVVVDLDRFKWVNDSHGHVVGDRVLVATADRLRGICTEGALACRTGGEEFVVVGLMPAEQLEGFAESIRAAIVAPNNGLEVSASVGVAWTARHGIDRPSDARPIVHNLTRLADRAMYEAKRAGGNRVRFHHDVNVV